MTKLQAIQEHIRARELLCGRKFSWFQKTFGVIQVLMFIKQSDIEQATANINADLVKIKV